MKKFFYRVQKDDDLFLIALRFNVPVCKLVKDNGLRSDVSAGDVIYVEIPKSVYRVKLKDDLFSIAEKFNITPLEILEKNSVPYIFYGLVLEV